MQNAVFLEGLRCDGSAHDGCQRSCLLFWKNAWLKPAANGAGERKNGKPGKSGQTAVSNGQALQLSTMKGDRFYCQSTELADATGEFPPGKLQHYLHDLRIGEISLGRFAYVLWRVLANRGWRLSARPRLLRSERRANQNGQCGTQPPGR